MRLRSTATRVLAGAALALAALVVRSGAVAGELTAEEQRFAKDLVAALGANSPRGRKAAEDGLARLGVDAIPTIAEALPAIKGEAQRKGLRRALDGMGRANVLAACERLARDAATKAAAKRIEDVAALVGG